LFPPTEVYNEGWLLRIILQWFSTQKFEDHPLGFSKSARWFSEALLPTAFLPRNRKDELGEAWTHADGVIGHFTIGDRARGDFTLKKDAEQFVVIEAKIFSKLSSGVTHARYFDQAARTVACMAEVLNRADRSPNALTHLAFYALAPESQISAGVFGSKMTKESVNSKVLRRVEEYGGERESWFREWFKPALESIEMSCLSWKSVIDDIIRKDEESGNQITDFYNLCKQFNKPERVKW
jgi:hypothetical protein